MSLHQTLRVSSEKLTALKELVPLEKHKERLFEIDKLLELGNVWDNPRKAGELAKERQKLSDIVEKLKLWQDGVDEDLEYCNAFAEEAERELTANAEMRLAEIAKFELLQLFRDPMDGNAAILSINAGAGGKDAQSFVSSLLRMYCRYCDANNLEAEIMDMGETEDGCIDSVSLVVSGHNAFGWLKSESGVHRIVRNSEFNSAGLRQTSFAAVRVLPDIDDTIEVKIDESQIDITAQRSGGNGGQNVQKVSSAVRLKYAPEGINILVRTERDFHKNKATAMKMLKAKLYDIEVQKKNTEKNKLNSTLTGIGFGNQIRSYVASPYELVKDHRTEYESRNIDDVLDGNIGGFLEAYLRMAT